MILVTHGYWTRAYGVPVVDNRRSTIDLPSWSEGSGPTYFGMLGASLDSNSEAGLRAKGAKDRRSGVYRSTDQCSGESLGGSNPSGECL